MRRIIKLTIYLLTLCLMPLAVASPSSCADTSQSAGSAHKRILILYAYNNNVPTLQKIAAGIKKVAESNNLRSADFVHEYLDITPPRFPAHRSKLGELLLQKYAGQQFDLIVTYSTEALSFLLNEGKKLSPGTPCIAMFPTLNKEMGQSERRVTKIPMELDVRGTLKLGLKLFPNTRKVLFVTGTAAIDKLFESQAQTEFASWQGKLEFEYTSQRSVEDLMKYVVQLPPHTLIIYSNLAYDISGKSFVPRDVVKTLASVSNAPVLSMFSTQIDTGVIGGSMIDMELLGVMIGNWMLALESGKPIVIEPASSYVRPMFNWTQIERWHLSTDRLPAESVFINRPLTLWGQYKAEVVSATLLIFILSAMTIALVIQNRRRKFAEMSARETAAQLATERDLLEQRVNERTANLSEVNDRLQQTNKELVKEITERKRAEEAFRAIFENNSAAMAIIEKDTTISMVNDEYCKMSLYDKENLIGTSWTTQIPHEDLERLKEYNRKRLINPEGAPGKYEFSFYRKDGDIRHSLMSIAMIQSPQKIICSFVDITDRKRAEEALAEEHIRLQQAFDEIKTLRGIVPICSYCKQIRDDKGYWSQVEQYVSDHTEAQFSHAICPICYEKVMKELKS